MSITYLCIMVPYLSKGQKAVVLALIMLQMHQVALSSALNLLPESGLGGMISEIPLSSNSVTQFRERLSFAKYNCYIKLPLVLDHRANPCSYLDPSFHLSIFLFKKRMSTKGSEEKSSTSSQFSKSIYSTSIPLYQDVPHQTLRQAICNISLPNTLVTGAHRPGLALIGCPCSLE